MNHDHLKLLLILPILATEAQALITGGEGNEEIADRGWPKGSWAVANLKSRIAHWEGPGFGGGQTTLEFREETTANFNKALALFAKVEAPKRELIVESGPKDSFWLGIRAREDEAIDARMDWSFVVWNEDNWKRLYNDPGNTFLADHPNFGRPVDPPRIFLYAGGGSIEWDEVEVPDGITVIDKRVKPGEGPAVTGTITDIGSGKPVTGAKVTLLAGQQNVAWKLPATTTGEDGRYELQEFPIGTYAVLARKDGHAPKRSLAYKEYLSGTTESVDLALSPAVELSGTVHGPDRKPVAGARVIARDVIGTDGFGYASPDGREVRTDDEGRFTIAGLPHGQCRLAVWSDGLYQPGSITTKYTLPWDKPLMISMIGTGTVEGTLVRSGKGQMNVSIEAPEGNVVGAWGGSMHCKPDGSFAFRNVPEGDYFVGPTSGPHLDRKDPSVKKVTVKAGETVTLELKD